MNPRWAYASPCARRVQGVVSHGRPGASYMRMIASLIALTGTDFSRKLPQITPKKVWEVLPVRTVWDGLERAFDPESSSLRVEEACDLLVSALYSLKFCNHVPAPCPSTVEGVIAALKRSKLSDKTKAQIPSRLRIEASPQPTHPTPKGDVCTFDRGCASRQAASTPTSSAMCTR